MAEIPGLQDNPGGETLTSLKAAGLVTKICEKEVKNNHFSYERHFRMRF